MANLENLGEVVSTDVLIVGGSIGGLVAAIKAKEYPVDVTVVEKQNIGWSGKVGRGRGGILVLAPDDDLDKFVEYNVRNIGHYINDQELLYSLASDTYGAVEQLAEWGVRVKKDEQGKLEITRKHRTGLCSYVSTDIDMLLPLRAKAIKSGVKMLNKVQVVELLKENNRVIGAVGFNIIDGRFYIFKAKAIILANGGCNYRVDRYHSSGCGDGIAAAYRAGAEIRNAEFGNFYGLRPKVSQGAHMVGGVHPTQDNVVNAKGENLFEKYVSGPQPDIAIEFVLGLEKEILEGRGPLYLEITESSPIIAGPSKLTELKKRTEAKELKYFPPPLERPEITLAFFAELTPIKVDHEMKTSLEGLWAVGDASNEGSSWAGAIFSPRSRLGGTGLMYAAVSGMWAGPTAGRFASVEKLPEIDEAEVRRLKDEIFAPIRRENGLSPADVISAVQEVVCPVKYNLRRSKERLEEGLSKIEELKQKLPELWAKDTHYLGKCHEARSMAACAEMTFRSALLRTESRGWHFREDYPERDDENWLKWVIVKQEDDKMITFTEPVPINKYKFKP
ncbi:FAD-dependent oxidoreductase [Chloroflexota bacterium]